MIPQTDSSTPIFQDINQPEVIPLYEDLDHQNYIPPSLNSWNTVNNYLQSQGIRPEHFHILIAGQTKFANAPEGSIWNPARMALRQALFWAKYNGCALHSRKMGPNPRYFYSCVTVPDTPYGPHNGRLDRELSNTPIVKILNKLISQSHIINLICKFIGYGHVLLNSNFDFYLPQGSMVAHADDFAHLVPHQYESETQEYRHQLCDFSQPFYDRNNVQDMPLDQFKVWFASTARNPRHLPFNVEQDWPTSDKRLLVFAVHEDFPYDFKTRILVHLDLKYKLIFVTPMRNYCGMNRVSFESNWSDNLAEATVGLETSRKFDVIKRY